MPELIYIVGLIVILLFGIIIFILSRYRKCPSDKVLMYLESCVKAGMENSDLQSVYIECLVIPVIQDYKYMD